MTFSDRRHAGRLLAKELEPMATENPIVVGLPRGGVPVAAEVARALHAPLDILLVRKIGVPNHAELAMGALGEGGATYVNDEIVARAGVGADGLEKAVAKAEAELQNQVTRFRPESRKASVDLTGRTVIVVDDGIATGATARAGLQVARSRGAVRVIVATPVAPEEVVKTLHREADGVVCLSIPREFWAVGVWYDDFEPVSDDEVIELLADQ